MGNIKNPSTVIDSVPAASAAFPQDQWYVAAFSREVTDKPLGRTLLNQPIVLFRTSDGAVAALDDRCCHRALPLSCGTVEPDGLRCGYHGLLFGGDGRCREIPGQARIPGKAFVRSHTVCEQDQLIWIWFGATADSVPTEAPPAYPVHSDPRYVFDGDVYHYDAPYQLIHDNLLDLSHLGYVHLQTIGGNARLHMHAETRVESTERSVRVVRYMPRSEPPPTYTAAYPFAGLIDRWQEIEFHVSHLLIWTGAVDAGSESVEDPNRGGLHMRGFHGITPETDETAFYFWTMATNPRKDPDLVKRKVIEQTAFTFAEDKVVIEAQYANMRRFAMPPMIDIHVDAGPNRARRIIDRLTRSAAAGGTEKAAPRPA